MQDDFVDTMSVPRRYTPAWYINDSLRVCRADACKSGELACPCPEACRLTPEDTAAPGTLQERVFFWIANANARDAWTFAGWFTLASFASLGALAYIIWG